MNTLRPASWPSANPVFGLTRLSIFNLTQRRLLASIATTLGTVTGNTAAYSKHYVLASGINGKGFVAEFARATVEAYVSKDAEPSPVGRR